jgi:hypothetical protein
VVYWESNTLYITSKLSKVVSEQRRGKIVYQSPEKSYTNVNIEETLHGYKVYRDGSNKPFSVIPFSAVRQIIYERE